MHHRILERFTVTFPNGMTRPGEVRQHPSRATGRRIIVRCLNGDPLFDSDECYDLGNAQNRLDRWVEDVEKLIRGRVTVGPLAEDVTTTPVVPVVPLLPA